MTIHHLAGEFHLPSAAPSYAPSLPLEPVHGELHLKPDLSAHQLQASITWTLLSNVKTAKSVQFHAEDLEFIRIQDDNGRECNWTYDGHVLEVVWTEAVPKGETRSLKINYQVQSPIAGLYFGGPTPEMPERGFWMASDHETSRARYWLPCIDHSNVRTTFDIYIQHEKEHVAVSAGTQIYQKEIDASTLETFWKLERRCPIYLLCVIVGEYERVDFEPLRNIPISGFAPKGNDPEDIRRSFAPTKELIEFAESLLGEFPWTKYFQFFAPQIGGAMENISLVSWDSRLLFDENMHADMGETFDQINLHELAHTWFGDLVVCRDYAHVWLKESWATYFECVWTEHKKSTDRFHLELLQKKERYFSEVATRYSRPIMTRLFDSPWKMYDMHLYPGGAVRLHMLRKKIGDDVFWEATRDYIQTYAEKVVETDDFRKILELHSGQSLAHFFDQWFARAGYPKLEVSQQYFHDSKVLRLQIKQSIVGGKKNDPAFDFPLTIAVETTEGTWEHHTLQIDSFHHSLRIVSEQAPLQIIIDPKCEAVTALDFKTSHDSNKRSLNSSPWFHGRVIAARNLCKQGNALALTVLSEEFSAQYYGVRQVIAKELATSKHPKAVDLLSEWLSIEEHPHVQIALVNALAAHRSQKTADSLAAFLHRDDISHRAKGTSLLALAKLGKYAPKDVIYQYCTHNGPRHQVREFAFQALGQFDTKEAFNLCIDAMHSAEQSYRVRSFAAGALVSIAKKRPKHSESIAEQELIQGLKDSNHNVRVAIVSALSRLGRASSIAHIESVRPQISSQYWPDIDKAIKSCRKHSDKPDLTALKKRVSELEEKQQIFLQQINDLQAQLHLNNNQS